MQILTNSTSTGPGTAFSAQDSARLELTGISGDVVSLEMLGESGSWLAIRDTDGNAVTFSANGIYYLALLPGSYRLNHTTAGAGTVNGYAY